MHSLRFITILAFSAVVSGTNDPVDCEVTTDFQDPSLRAGVLSASVPIDNKLPSPYRGLQFYSTFRVFQSTALEQNPLNPNKFIYSNGGDSLKLHLVNAVDGVAFSQLKLEQYSTFCVARTDSTAVTYLIDCTVEVIAVRDPNQPVIDTFEYKKAQRIQLSALSDDFFETHKVTKLQSVPAVEFQVTFHPDSIAQLLGGNSITGYGVSFDNFKYGLQKAPGSRAPCPSTRP
ncbi:hypothetical protein PG995_009589 [Apiospora arundinis]